MYATSLTCCLFFTEWLLTCHGFLFESRRNFAHAKGSSEGQPSSEGEYLDLKDVEFLDNGEVLVISYNVTMAPTRSNIRMGDVRIYFNRSDELKRKILEDCEKWIYDRDEFKVLENGSIELLSTEPQLLEPGTYEICDGTLHTCCSEEAYDYSSSNQYKSTSFLVVSVMLGRVGCSISIVALAAHLIIFCMVPPLRNLPGYNLASLSLAFLVAFSSSMVGQIPSVLGASCVILGFLQLNCFLVAFFCMNVMAFDVWRTLRMATLKLAVSSQNKKKTQFILYTIYSWGVPLLITASAIACDFTEGVPSWIKPGIGDHMICWVTQKKAKIIFFSIPAFSLFTVNGVFFVLSAVIIKRNTMKNAHPHSNARLNFVLYVRLGLMMGVTWLMSVLATVINNNVIWLISDFLNPLQGLFIFILFTCSRKVIKYIKLRVSPKTSITEKKSCSSSGKRVTAIRLSQLTGR